MKDDLTDLPPELAKQFLSFLREEDGTFQVADKEGLVKFVAEHGERYPALLKLFTVNNQALVEHFEKTGRVPPGIKLTKITSTEGSNVTQVEIFHGPRPGET